MQLISFRITPNNRKVEAFIAHYDLPVEVRQIDFKHKENQSPEFLALNPMGKVPVLVDGEFSLWESNAILVYLAKKFPETKALPGDIQGQADVDRWLHWQSCHLMPLMGALKTGAEQDPAAIKPLFSVLEKQLADGRDFILGDLTVADFAVAAYLMTKMGSAFDYAEHPRVAAWRSRMESLKGFQQTLVKLPPAAT